MSNLPHNRAMHIFHGRGFWVEPEWKELLSEMGLDDHTDWRELSSKDLVSGSYHTTSNFRLRLSNGQVVYFKRYVYRKLRLKHWLQPSKAAIEVAGYHDLKKIGINTLTPVAYGEMRFMGILRAAFIVTLNIPDTIQLDQFLIHQWHSMETTEKRKWLQFIQPQLIHQLTSAHQAGFFHWDLKLRNILLKHVTEEDCLIWIDCPRSRFMKPFSEKGVISDLTAMARIGSLVLTPGQRMRFLMKYTNGNRSKARNYYQNISRELAKRPPRSLEKYIQYAKKTGLSFPQTKS
ncbi:MAG: hypothetical protein EP297_06500 [Gammaproteobacteria bacterium]|nr:MAG: hypothetical protein EP297_06500 [Gammaproteobacteria bacterium]